MDVFMTERVKRGGRAGHHSSYSHEPNGAKPRQSESCGVRGASVLSGSHGECAVRRGGQQRSHGRPTSPWCGVVLARNWGI
jgi:hypothetical protein